MTSASLDHMGTAHLLPQIGSSILAQAAGVPTLPWSGSGVAISFADCGGDIPTEVYDQVRSQQYSVPQLSLWRCCLSHTVAQLNMNPCSVIKLAP
jgi:hypothetical protein